ncbi:hypothetical protein [Mycobacteroides chelonae]|uniref:hypothetical protein n=1 Tax=Mycobacteroides chelonae TaxID=1774 RepID=UPI0005C4F534|nr:hypothetical protein [Mycobacteroides chelonae]OHT67811.1 hypothetical protein BKG66_24615 [Mycobacteroides chelonae]OHT69454.1 hypothetical protein BKG67_23150 [Mycobacteroides chelonae]
MTIEEIIEQSTPQVAALAAYLGFRVAAEEAREEYGEPEDYPEPLKKFLDRGVEVAEQFINKLGVE